MGKVNEAVSIVSLIYKFELGITTISFGNLQAGVTMP